MLCLEHVFIDNYYADKVIERVFKENPKWGSRDRAFVAETVYDIVRYWRLLNEVLGLDYSQPKKQSFDAILQTYFLLLKNHIPSFDWQNKINTDDVRAQYQLLQSKPQVINSFPDWMHEYGKSNCSSDWNKEMDALNVLAPVVLRVNTLKTEKDSLKKLLLQNDIEVEDSLLSENALILKKRTNVFSNPLFKEGLYEVQDEGSQVIGDFCKVQPSMRVIDACAGAGGKSLELAALMKNKGKIVAMDVEPRKLEELKKRARRAGAFNVETRLIEGAKTIKKLESSADLVLLDVPCSGSGVLRRNPDAKWKLKPEFIEKIQSTQEAILNDYSKMVKPGGTLVYSTCSLFSTENQNQVEKFLSSHPDFQLEESRTLTPALNNTDGFFMARLKRVN